MLLRVAYLSERGLPSGARLGPCPGYLPIVIYPPDESGGRRVRVDGEILGMAHSLRDVTEFLRRAGMDDITEEDVILSGIIDWRGGGLNLWPAPW
ncbi:hypothetical protein [Streptomyces sp. NPDC001999]